MTNMNKITAPYLKVTIFDNDFYASQQLVGKVLQEIFLRDGYPTTESLPLLKDYVGQLWYAIHNIQHILDSHAQFCRSEDETPLHVFQPELQIADYTEIPDWNNAEDIYIPLFEKNSEILCV